MSKAPKPLTPEELAGYRKWVSEYNEPESLDLLATIDRLQALYDAAWAECGASRAMGHPNMHDRISPNPHTDPSVADYYRQNRLDEARAHHDALRANKENT